MSLFTGPIRLEHMDADLWRTWKLLEPLTWEVDEIGSGRFITVPTDFVTDGASVPRLLWWLFPSTGPYLRAACLHDWLLALLRDDNPHAYAPTKRKADWQFYLAMRACNTSFAVRWIMYFAVRFFASATGRR